MTPKELHALAHASMGTFVFIVASTIYAELSAPFKTMLATTFGHHWVGKGVISLVLLVGLYYFFKSKQAAHVGMWHIAKHVSIAAILSGLVIFIFYVYEFVGV